MNEKTHSRYDTARKILIFWTLFICIGAVGGAAMMLLDPSGKSIGMDAMLPYFQVLPFADVVFRDFTFSGWALLIVNGLTNLTAAVLLLRKKRMGAVLYEIKATELTDGTLGFWWCGRYGMHRWDMPIEPVEPELESFEHVTICSPIWVFTPCGPIKAFCRECAGRIRCVSYIISHYNNTAYTAAADELDKILGVKHSAFRSVRCRQGVFKTIRQN